MNTGVENYYEMRWVLRAIKRERSLTPAGENVKININKLTDRDPDAPAMDDVRKYIKLFESRGVFRVEKKYINDPSEAYDPPDATWERATSFELAINQDLFDAVCGGYENPVGPIDLKSDDAVYFKEEKSKIGAIKYPEDHRIALNKWLEIKGILDAIHVQLSPMGDHNQTANLNLKKTHKNISGPVLDDLWRRGICGYGGGAQSPDWERFYYMQGSLIEVRDLNRFNNYRNGVTDFVKWIENDAARFSKKQTDSYASSDESMAKISQDETKQPTNRAKDVSKSDVRKIQLLGIIKEEWELTPRTGEQRGVITVRWGTYTSWISRALLDNHEQLERLLNLFATEGLIQWKILDPYGSTSETTIEIRFPDDFESRHESYTSQILGEDKYVAPKNNEIKPFPHKLPRGTKWEHFTIKFLDKEKVLITVKGKKHETNFVEMGFDDKRDGKPDQQWSLLLVLARKGGELTWKDSEAQKKYKKTVQLLADCLSAYFTQIDRDPFWPYDDIDPLEKPKKSYKIKIRLIPPPGEENISDPEDEDKLGIHEELDKFNNQL